MAQGLHLSQRMTQSLVLSPQMQQSLASLQAPTLELKALVEQELQQNPVLEEAPTPEADQVEKVKSDDGETSEDSDPAEPPADLTGERENDREPEKGEAAPAEDFWRNSSVWPNWIRIGATTMRRQTCRRDKRPRRRRNGSSCSIRLVAATSLQEILLEQVREANLTEEQRRDRRIAGRQH